MIDKFVETAKKVKNAGVNGVASVISKTMGEETGEAAKQSMNDKIDAIELYTTESINAAEGYLEEHDASGKVSRFRDNASDLIAKAKTSGNKAVDHFTNDRFDEQTAAIREELKHGDDNDDQVTDDDIIIDATKTDDEDDEKSGDSDADDDDQSKD